MTESDEDRFAVERMGEGFSDAERERHEAAERTIRRRDTPVALRTNCETGESISPSGTLRDGEVARLERVRLMALDRYGRSG